MLSWFVFHVLYSCNLRYCLRVDIFDIYTKSTHKQSHDLHDKQIVTGYMNGPLDIGKIKFFNFQNKKFFSHYTFCMLCKMNMNFPHFFFVLFSSTGWQKKYPIRMNVEKDDFFSSRKNNPITITLNFENKTKNRNLKVENFFFCFCLL